MAGLCWGGNEPPDSLKAMRVTSYELQLTSMLYVSGRQHWLKCAKGKRCRPVCTAVQQEKVQSILASSYECTMVHCVLRGCESEFGNMDDIDIRSEGEKIEEE
ncbi:hypothetical protein ANN_19633 [Periplaneta americana]|uniref:Uncharacterized protein n=1 Tax=Periplaneta americana TaxID=6978 RepID=A0ABQ8SBB6_PERAM|nr:hypothetical protein ANN_19633 [Periplaneta americana]